MINGLRPYPAMKASGLPWLGDVPSHWDVRRNGRLFGARRETSFPELPVLEVSIRSGVRVRDFAKGGRKQEMGNRSKYQRAVRGDIAYNMMRMWQGAVGIAPADGLVSPAYVVARPFPETDAAYYAYLFRIASYMREIDTFSRGIVPDRNRLYWESFKQMPSIWPPLVEQRLIVRFLDWHGARAAKLVRAKKKLIALLNEQKQAIVHGAITRGLDPNVRLKPTGITWIPEAPIRWAVFPLKTTCTIQSGITLGKNYAGHVLREYPYLRVANVQAGRVNLAIVKTVMVPELEAKRSFLQPGDVLMTEGGDADKLGRGCVWDAPIEGCLHQNHVFAVRPDLAVLSPKFLAALLGTPYAKAYFEATAKQTTNLASTNKTKIGQFPILLPDLDEQNKIVDSLALMTLPTERLVGREAHKIDLMREFRTRLIADVVTGKLDVRAAAASLPDTTELEPIDEPAEDEDLDDAMVEAETEEVAA